MRAVLIDLDNTLHDFDAALERFVRFQFREFRLHKDGIEEQAWLTRFAELDDGGKVWKDQVYASLCSEFNPSCPSERLLRHWNETFSGKVQANPEAAPLLRELRQRGFKTGIVSNGLSVFQRRTLAATGLESLLDTVVISEECGLRKPDPAIFHLALKNLAARPEESWFVGDNPTADIQGAHSAGLRTLWFRTFRFECPLEANGEITNLADVLNFV